MVSLFMPQPYGFVSPIRISAVMKPIHSIAESINDFISNGHIRSLSIEGCLVNCRGPNT